MKSKSNTLLLIYNSFNDPLFQNILLSYFKIISDDNLGDVHLLTFEQEEYYLDEQERVEIKKELAHYNIFWYPLNFHTGKFLLFKKAFDFLQASLLIIKIKIKYKIKVIFSFANVASAIAILIKKVLNLKMIIYSYEPHSEFMTELGLWDRKSLKFRTLNYLEKLAGRDADYIMTGTKHMVERLRHEKTKAKVYRAPTAVDENDFYFRKEERLKIRKKLGVIDRYVVLYLGKFGDLYYKEEIPRLSKEIKKVIPSSFFLVVTSNDHNEINALYSTYFEDTDFHITGHLSFDQVKEYISASDIGISAVPPTPSQKYRSPTKVAEYLLCGIPIITSKGIAEDDIYAEKNNIGVVIGNFQEPLNQKQIKVLKSLFYENKDTRRSRCRNVGLEYRSRMANIEIMKSIYRDIEINE